MPETIAILACKLNVSKMNLTTTIRRQVPMQVIDSIFEDVM